MRVAKYDVSPAGEDQQRGYHAKLMKLEDNVTTRADVTRWLGTPQLAEDAGRLAAYRWQRVRYEAYAFIPFEDTDVEAETTAVLYSSLLLEFDDAGVLRRHRKVRHRVEYGGPPALPDLLAAWRRT